MLFLKNCPRFLVNIFAGVGLLLSLSLIGCNESDSKKDKSHALVMGTSADCIPFEYHKTANGKDEIVGLDIDLAYALTKELGIKIVIQDMDFNSLIPSLHSGRTDFVMALMTPTEERSKNISFSDIYFINRVAVVTSKDKEIAYVSQLAGKKIGVQLGSTNELTGKELATKIQGLEIFSLNKLNELIQEVRAGRLDGVLVEAIPAKAFVESNDDLHYTVFKELETHFAIAFPKNSPLVEKFNDTLKKLKAEGKLEKIVQKWIKEK